MNTDCSSTQACISEKCRDPCPGSCGYQANCRVQNHIPVCSCEPGFTGDPFTQCSQIIGEWILEFLDISRRSTVEFSVYAIVLKIKNKHTWSLLTLTRFLHISSEKYVPFFIPFFTTTYFRPKRRSENIDWTKNIFLEFDSWQFYIMIRTLFCHKSYLMLSILLQYKPSRHLPRTPVPSVAPTPNVSPACAAASRTTKVTHTLVVVPSVRWTPSVPEARLVLINAVLTRVLARVARVPCVTSSIIFPRVLVRLARRVMHS